MGLMYNGKDELQNEMVLKDKYGDYRRVVFLSSKEDIINLENFIKKTHNTDIKGVFKVGYFFECDPSEYKNFSLFCRNIENDEKF